jgi:hypothetical protein
MLRVMILLFGILAGALAAAPAQASQACHRDDTGLKPLPAGFVPSVQTVFGLQHEDRAWIQKTTVLRCMGGKLWACNLGANLPCGKANTAATLQAGGDWCRHNPNADVIPAYITGHDSIWAWRCVKGVPETTGPPAALDRQGYLVRYWKMLNG